MSTQVLDPTELVLDVSAELPFEERTFLAAIRPSSGSPGRCATSRPDLLARGLLRAGLLGHAHSRAPRIQLRRTSDCPGVCGAGRRPPRRGRKQQARRRGPGQLRDDECRGGVVREAGALDVGRRVGGIWRPAACIGADHRPRPFARGMPHRRDPSAAPLLRRGGVARIHARAKGRGGHGRRHRGTRALPTTLRCGRPRSTRQGRSSEKAGATCTASRHASRITPGYITTTSPPR